MYERIKDGVAHLVVLLSQDPGPILNVWKCAIYQRWPGGYFGAYILYFDDAYIAKFRYVGDLPLVP